MIIVVVLHMTQVFLWGAYKKPREATWMVGCVLLLMTLAFGLTGYLLPWDNRAYWGTMVTTQIAVAGARRRARTFCDCWAAMAARSAWSPSRDSTPCTCCCCRR